VGHSIHAVLDALHSHAAPVMALSEEDGREGIESGDGHAAPHF
jgi:hypothetical protein